MSSILTVASIALNPTGFLVSKIAEYALESIKDDPSKKTLEELELVAKKQELQMQMAEAQAKVAQELAIAKRIEIAEEVEIEEFYDLNADGSLGVKAKEQSISLGASASGRRVSKRIYKFRGVNSELNKEDGSNHQIKPTR
ncbi:MAG: hypothetical protein PHX69_00890 [Simplicispira sp.]|uniref:hypothetical protein n=1 Tax=Simplicispira sp. TaxID=2015802 RepID=UPI002585A665|nr:hypothetical protein [Simplicispira sp.]MDD2690322.1 hypothetical protein [Simplicispira sp.]